MPDGQFQVTRNLGTEGALEKQHQQNIAALATLGVSVTAHFIWQDEDIHDQYPNILAAHTDLLTIRRCKARQLQFILSLENTQEHRIMQQIIDEGGADRIKFYPLAGSCYTVSLNWKNEALDQLNSILHRYKAQRAELRVLEDAPAVCFNITR